MEGGMGSMMPAMSRMMTRTAASHPNPIIQPIIALVRMIGRGNQEQTETARATAAKVVLVVLAAIGAVALVGAGAMAVMHSGMMNCC
jgi:hypothetical protein